MAWAPSGRRGLTWVAAGLTAEFLAPRLGGRQTGLHAFTEQVSLEPELRDPGEHRGHHPSVWRVELERMPLMAITAVRRSFGTTSPGNCFARALFGQGVKPPLCLIRIALPSPATCRVATSSRRRQSSVCALARIFCGFLRT